MFKRCGIKRRRRRWEKGCAERGPAAVILPHHVILPWEQRSKVQEQTGFDGRRVELLGRTYTAAGRDRESRRWPNSIYTDDDESLHRFFRRQLNSSIAVGAQLNIRIPNQYGGINFPSAGPTFRVVRVATAVGARKRRRNIINTVWAIVNRQQLQSQQQ